MEKQIVPFKMVITYTDDGKFSKAMLLYRMKMDGVLDTRKFYSTDVSKGVKKTNVDSVLLNGEKQAKKTEKIIEVQ